MNSGPTVSPSLIFNSVQIHIVALFLFLSVVFCSMCSVRKHRYTSFLVSKKEWKILKLRKLGLKPKIIEA